MPETTALDLLKNAESLLSALHGSVARHDNLAANLGCAGCELRDEIRAALPTLSAVPSSAPADRPTPDFTSPLADRIEVREPCPWCPDRPMVPRSLMDDHCARLHPDVQVQAVLPPTTDRTALREPVNPCTWGVSFCGQHGYDCPPLAGQAGLRDRIAKAVDEGFRLHAELEDASLGGSITDSVLTAVQAAVLPEAVDQAAILREAAERVLNADHLPFVSPMGRKDVATLLRRMAGEAPQPETGAFVCKCPAELCHCGHHAVVSQPGKEA